MPMRAHATSSSSVNGMFGSRATFAGVAYFQTSFQS